MSRERLGLHYLCGLPLTKRLQRYLLEITQSHMCRKLANEQNPISLLKRKEKEDDLHTNLSRFCTNNLGLILIPPPKSNKPDLNTTSTGKERRDLSDLLGKSQVIAKGLRNHSHYERPFHLHA